MFIELLIGPKKNPLVGTGYILKFGEPCCCFSRSREEHILMNNVCNSNMVETSSQLVSGSVIDVPFMSNKKFYMASIYVL